MPKYRLKDGKEIVPSGKYVIETPDDTYNLVIPSVTDEDAGQFTVIATNDFGKSSFTATLITHGWLFLYNVIALHLYSATCIASEALLVTICIVLLPKGAGSNAGWVSKVTHNDCCHRLRMRECNPFGQPVGVCVDAAMTFHSRDPNHADDHCHCDVHGVRMEDRNPGRDLSNPAVLF